MSDLHAPMDPAPDHREIVAAALDDIRSMHAESPMDLVVFSGDLSYDGRPESFRSAQELFLDPLQSLLPDVPTVLVPGNHDVTRDAIGDVVELGLRAKLVDRESVTSTLTDQDLLAQAIPRLAYWNEFHSEWLESDSLRTVGSLGQIQTLDIGGFSVAVAALNTAWRASTGEGDRGRLLVGEHQIHEALAAVEAADIRIVVMHHPLDWLAEFDATAARVALESNGVFVLTGHEHSADPTLEISTRGAALYSRAGCLYADHKYANGYTVLDLAPGRAVRVSVRRWWSDRRAFDQATDWHRGGAIDLPWPLEVGALPAHRVPLHDVLAPLADVARDQSVLAEALSGGEDTTVVDLVIEPRLWPVPHHEVFDAAVPADQRPEALDPVDVLTKSQVVIVSGDHSSGVTTSLLWLLERHYRSFGTHIPEYVADARFGTRRLSQAVSAAGSRYAGGTDRVVLAVDNVVLHDERSVGRLLRFVADHPHVTLLVGCHGDEHAQIAEGLAAHEITHQRAFLGPFGRGELRQLVSRIAGSGAGHLVNRVLRILHRQRLPRTPLNLAALVAVITREQDLTAVNESGLLQSYVTLLLENPVVVDPDGLMMDYRRREHLLERLAQHLVVKNVTRISRVDAEQLVLDYFKAVGWKSGSAGQLLDSLVGRRVLSQGPRGVGFRYPALLHLFAAKCMLDDASFAERMQADLVRYAPIIRHAAGLRRNDAELLQEVATTTRRVIAEGAPGVSPGQFDLISDEEGWSQVNDLREARKLVRPSPEPPTEEELDRWYDEVVEDPQESTDIQLFDEPGELELVDRVGPSVSLLASVLQSSELVADVELKAVMLREVINGWSVLTVMAAVQEDEKGELRAIVEALFQDGRASTGRQGEAEHFARVFVVTLMSISLYLDVGSVHLQAVLERAADDEAFMAVTANALFTTMLQAALGFDRWHTRVTWLHETHGDHPMVREVLRRWALNRYQRGSMTSAESDELENMLVDMLTPRLASGGSGAITARARQKSDLRARLRQSRTQAQWASGAKRGNTPLFWPSRADADREPASD